MFCNRRLPCSDLSSLSREQVLTLVTSTIHACGRYNLVPRFFQFEASLRSGVCESSVVRGASTLNRGVYSMVLSKLLLKFSKLICLWLA
jgi:hypothetical protein